jgi:hypothetical protein
LVPLASAPILRFDRATALVGSMTLKPARRPAMPPQEKLQSTRASSSLPSVFVAGSCFGTVATAPCAYSAQPNRDLFVPKHFILLPFNVP